MILTPNLFRLAPSNHHVDFFKLNGHLFILTMRIQRPENEPGPMWNRMQEKVVLIRNVCIPHVSFH